MGRWTAFGEPPRRRFFFALPGAWAGNLALVLAAGSFFLYLPAPEMPPAVQAWGLGLAAGWILWLRATDRAAACGSWSGVRIPLSGLALGGSAAWAGAVDPGAGGETLLRWVAAWIVGGEIAARARESPRESLAWFHGFFALLAAVYLGTWAAGRGAHDYPFGKIGRAHV